MAKKPSRKAALEEAVYLFEKAREQAIMGEEALSHRYVEIARKKAMTSTARLPSVLRRQYCHRCYGYLGPGARRRLSRGVLVTTCPSCRHINHYVYGKQFKRPVGVAHHG